MSKKLLLLIYISFILVGCNLKSNRYIDDAFMVAYTDQGPFLCNLERSFSLSEYDEIVPIFNDIITVGKKTKNGMRYGFINKTGKEIIKPIYEAVSMFSEGKAVVSLNGKQLIINDKNKVLYEFPNEIKSYSYFSNNYLVISIDDQYSYLDEDFNIIQNRLAYAGVFRNGFAVVGELIDNNIKYYHINKDGDKVGTKLYDFADDFYDGYARVGLLNNGIFQYQYIDVNGNVLTKNFLPLTYDYAQNFANGFAVTASYEINSGVKDSLPFKYKKFDIIDTNGISVPKVSLQDISGLGIFSSIGNSYQNVFPIKGCKDINGIFLFRYYNEMFEELTPKSTNLQEIPNDWTKLLNFDYFKPIENFEKGYARVQISDLKYGIISHDGTYLVDPIYDYLFF